MEEGEAFPMAVVGVGAFAEEEFGGFEVFEVITRAPLADIGDAGAG